MLCIQYDNHRIVDSIPIYACKLRRAHFHKTFRCVVPYGRCASKKETYYGFKLHTLNTLEGYLTSYVLTLIADKGYIGKQHADALFNEYIYLTFEIAQKVSLKYILLTKVLIEKIIYLCTIKN
ncbi:hypothetical protein FDG42_04150 [Clostridium botulinum]|nr:hypothetical protein [Clostridium botulinum]MBZ1332200.1 hypothetical protein [Clostridium botulinum]MBZ1336216.1 hypothetical protein [Clostridium botulinum]MBZ1338687.1 hypothetical protein [Clostridium botulinum]MBZ1344381.1 hypothetical protein [Clostridium botulinum]